ncbi:MAG: hypothetical protein ACPHHQ_02955 [Pseudomonadales bacterium]
MNQKTVFLLFVIAFGLAWYFNTESSNGNDSTETGSSASEFISKFSIMRLFSEYQGDWDFPRNLPPFNNKDFLLSQCEISDSLCGRYNYRTEWETGEVTLFKAGDVYYLEYQPEDNPPYIGMGILSGSSLAVTFAFAGNQDIGITLYTIEDDTLSGAWTCFEEDCVGKLNFENLTKRPDPFGHDG